MAREQDRIFEEEFNTAGLLMGEGWGLEEAVRLNVCCGTK